MDNYVLSGFTAGQLASDFRALLESGSFIREELGETAAEPRLLRREG